MAYPEMRAAMVLAVRLAGCDGGRDQAVQGSVTVQLPPAKAAAPVPSFSFKAPEKQERAQEAASNSL